MRRWLHILFVGLLLPGCGVGGGAGGGGVTPLPLPLPIPIILPIPASALYNTEELLEGRWILQDSAAARSCFVIQELRVSIFDASCNSNGSGMASRIFDPPIITRASDTIIIRVTYNLRANPERKLRMIFTGELQPDGSFIGFRRDEDLIAGTVIPERFAIMSRP